jgi:hypothetical protein
MCWWRLWRGRNPLNVVDSKHLVLRINHVVAVPTGCDR